MSVNPGRWDTVTLVCSKNHPIGISPAWIGIPSMSLPAESSFPPSARAMVIAIGYACALLGLMVLVGWTFHIALLVQLRPQLPPMQFNTALCLTLTGAALLAWARQLSPRLFSTVGIAVAAVGALTLVEYLFHLNLRIDQVFLTSYIHTGTSSPGRMSPVGSLCFLFIGICIALLRDRTRPCPVSPYIGVAASLVISVSAVAILGYVFNLPATYAWASLTSIAISSAVGLGAAGVALFTIAWNAGCRPDEATPRWLPAPLALAVIVASLIFYFAFSAKQSAEIDQAMSASAENLRSLLELRIEARSRALMRMAERWDFDGGTAQLDWQNDANDSLRDFPDWQSIEWIDGSGTIRWIAPLAGNEAKVDKNLSTEPNRKSAMDEALATHQPVISKLVTLFNGGLGFVVYVPLTAHGQPDGYLAAVVNARQCLTRYLPSVVAEGEAISISESGQRFFNRNGTEPPRNSPSVATTTVKLRDAAWTLQVWPTAALTTRFHSQLPQLVLLAGSLAALLFAAVCYFAQRTSRQAHETFTANTALQAANTALKAAIDQVKTLQGLLPICSCCKRVRDDTGYWSQIDTYLSDHTDASLSHGYCPECAAKTFKDFGFEVPPQVQAQLDEGRFEPAPSAIQVGARS
jgi:sensor domain CHASE-containing protein